MNSTIPYKLLLVDDDQEVLQLNAKYLTAQGYAVKITTHPEMVEKFVKDTLPDCVILDVMMPNLNGFNLCKRIRSFSDVPIIFLSGKAEENDRIEGIMLGADDYITKPYSMRELAARIHTNIRRKNIGISSNIISFPPMSVDTIQHKVFYNDEEIALSNREYELLLLLISNKNKTVTFEEIAHEIWGSYSETDRRSIMVNASRLRKKLDLYPGLGQMIETVWSQGYKFLVK